METSVVGTNVARLDAPDKVTGQASYVADLHLPGMVHAKLLLSKHAHARIKGLDITRAREYPGVVEIITWKDVPSDYYGELVFDQQLFAKDKVRFCGDVIALVAGETAKAAQEAVNLIALDYEPLPALLDTEDALKPDAQQIHEDYSSFRTIPPLAGMFEEVKALGIKNLAWQSEINKGEVDAGFAQADKILEERYSTDMGQAVPLEPRAVVAAPNPSGKVTIWTTTQVPFGIRSHTARALKLAMTKIRVIAPAVGGGFGSKCQIGFEPHLAAMALKVGRPVKLVLERAEDQATANPRHPARICIKSGVKKDGTLLARKIDIVLDTGHCSSLGPVAAGFSCFLSCGPYKIANLAVSSATVYTNKPSCSMVRAPTAPQITFAVESHTDNLARALNMDPLAFRLKNIVDERDYGPTNQVLRSVSLRDTLTQAAQKANWGSSPGPKRGVGLACGWWGTAMGQGSAATVVINEDGTVRLLTGAAEQGSGSAYGGLAQIVAEELQVPLTRISVLNADTDATPWDFGAVGSRTMFNAGHAVRMAAAEVKSKLLNMAAGMLEARVDDLVLSQGKVYVKGSPDKAVPYGMLCASAPSSQYLKYLRENWTDFALMVVAAIVLAGYARYGEVLSAGAIYVIVTQIYILAALIIRGVNVNLRFADSGIQPARLLVGSFVFMCLVGSGLLMLPAAITVGEWTRWHYDDSLFTATSATCVTGLVVKPTGSTFTPFGQAVILGLIQLGGLGIMMFGTVMAMMVGKML
ncbi:MAG: molybdopterin cofactor-binding domain-containing protein, partial [Thermodesulfobacteriota bacterium]